MVKINRIYTKAGDSGTTLLASGEIVAKDSDRIEALGQIDELNSCLGLVRCLAASSGLKLIAPKIGQIQNELFDFGAELALAKVEEKVSAVTPETIQRIESWIDEALSGLPELRSFVIPGESELEARINLTRSVCRRAERTLWKLHRVQPLRETMLIYLNRLSDFLFALTRYEAKEKLRKERLWQPGKR